VRYTAVELIAKRAQVSADISTALRSKLAIYAGAPVPFLDVGKAQKP